jgi:hypothetical protein
MAKGGSMTPLALQILIHAYVSPVMFPNHYLKPQQEALDWFDREGVIKVDYAGPGCMKTTPKGDAWVKAILAVAMPMQVWVDEHGRAIR